MTPELSTGPLDITAAVAALAPAVRTRAVPPAMMILRPILIIVIPPLMTRDATNVTPARRATTPRFCLAPPFSRVRRDEDGSGLPTCCNRDPFVPRATLGTVWARGHARVQAG